MSIFRVEKTANYTVMSNHHLKNKNLSLKSKGLLSQMLSLPDNWNYCIKGFSGINKDGEDSIRTAIKELETEGYVIRNRIRNEAGKITDTEYVIYKQPQVQGSSSPLPINGSQSIRLCWCFSCSIRLSLSIITSLYLKCLDCLESLKVF